MTRARLAALLLGLVALVPGGRAAAAPEDPAPEPAIAYVGRVLDPDGRPLAGATVFADNGGSYQVMQAWDETPWRHWVPDPLRPAATGPFTRRSAQVTGADGAFRVDDVPPPVGHGWVLVVHPDYVAARADVRGGATADSVAAAGDVRLTRGGAVRVTVRTPDGAPAADAWVVVRPESAPKDDRTTFWSGDEEPGDVRVGRTDAAGECTVRGLRPGGVRVASFTASHVPSVVGATVKAEAADPARVAIQLAPGATLRVEVASAEPSAPVAGARVVVDRPEAGRSWPGPPPVARATTGADGAAAIEGIEPLDEYRITVTPPDFANDTVNQPGAFSVSAPAKPGETVRVVLARPLTFRVRLVDGYTKRPVEGASVVLWPDWDRFRRELGAPVDLHPAWDAGSREYVTPSARAGSWTVGAWAPGYLPGGATNVEIAAPAADGSAAPAVEVIELDPAVGFATGRIVGQRDGASVAGAQVASYEWISRLGGGQCASATTDAAGAFRLAPLLGRDWPLRLEITAPGFCRRIVEWQAGARPDPLGDLPLVRAATVRGRVTRADGKPVARVAVEMVDAAIRGRGKGESLTAVTDAEGRYVLEGVFPGSYVILGHEDAGPIDVAEGAVVERDVVR